MFFANVLVDGYWWTFDWRLLCVVCYTRSRYDEAKSKQPVL